MMDTKAIVDAIHALSYLLFANGVAFMALIAILGERIATALERRNKEREP